MATGSLIARRTAKTAIVLAALLILGPYAVGPIYQFPDPTSFSGAELYNPYAEPSATWQRANFHSHGRAWMGLTNGEQPSEEVARRYRALGYDVPGVSNYQRIAINPGVSTLPIYEHGYNITKQHQLAIGAHSVEWLDFMLWQSRSHQQYVIDRVRRKSDLVALAHPATRDAYTVDDMQALTGYDLIEIVNGPFSAVDVWDAALSSGHPVWAVADDDTHDLEDQRRTAVGWNMVGADSADRRDIVDALDAGRTYAVLRLGAIEAANLTVLNRVEVNGAQMRVSLNGAASNITFVGQNGVVRKTVAGANTADYIFSDRDTYIRTVVETPQTVLYLNPVLRYDGKTLPSPSAHLDATATWTFRRNIVLGLGLSAWVLSRWRQSRRAVPSTVTGTVLTGVKGNTV